ncbi:MAG: amidase [Actinobacteria bacterium]|nr:amidase [Actinomycetota bacterium]
MTDLAELTALETAAAIRERQVSAVEVTEAALRRAEADAWGAFVTLAPDLALRQAADIDRRLADEPTLDLPLLGVPCPIKDLNPVAGVGFEAGSTAMRGNLAEVDDGIVEWLREAGTTMLGKTATPEFGFPCYTEPDGRPPAATPWDPTRSAGGSSGGAAAAVAAGIVPIAQASDGGGSIRIPASACGLVGLKPSRGRVSSGPLMPPGPGLATAGVLTRTVADTAAALDVLAGYRTGDTYVAPPPSGSFLAATRLRPTGLRIGVLTTPVIAEAEVHPACLEAVTAAVRLLQDAGHVMEEAPAPFAVERWDAFTALWTVGAASIPLPPEADPLLTPLTRWLREQGRGVTALEHAAALAELQRLTREVALAWDEFDLILTPTLAQPPAPIGSLRDDTDPAGDFAAQTRFTPWTSVCNLSGLPAISLPLHVAEVDGIRLPIGIMLGARFGAEETLLSVGAALEEAAGGWEQAGPWRRVPTLA